MKKILIPLLLALQLVLSGCGQKLDGDGMVYKSYNGISQEEAKEMMAQDDGHVIVDVRRQDEYDAGHIPGAILIPNESIDMEQPEELPDLDQIILIYCRSGNRSKQAAQKLFNMGYTNIYEFGGINDWTGDIVTSEEEANAAGEAGESGTTGTTETTGETSQAAGKTADEAVVSGTAQEAETAQESGEMTKEQNIYLTLVNPTHKVPDNWLDLVELVEAENSLGEKYLVEKEALSHFEDLRNELLEEGIDIEIDSAYRSVEKQQEIWDEFSVRYGDKVGEIVSEPGYSEHHTGLAIDVFLIDDGTIIRDNDDLFAAEELFAKVHKHLADHGFIISVLPGKEEICGGLAYEPWHFRYVGLEPAKEMAEKGIVLEEYLGEESNK